jgi:hypothetical protein
MNKIVLSLAWVLSIFVEHELAADVSLVYGYLFCSISLMCLLLCQYHGVLINKNFVVYFKISWYAASYFVLLLKIALAV